MDDQRSFVLQSCKDQDIKFIRLWFTDILGTLKSFAITQWVYSGAPVHDLRELAA